MKHFNANGMTMSQILGFSKPIEEENDLDRAELLYQKRLAHLDQIGGGQVLSNGQMPDQVRHDVLLGGQGQVKADLSIPAQVNTSFVPYITSVGKQCLQPMAYGIKLIALLFFVSLLFNNAALAQSHENGGAVDGVGDDTGKNWQVNLRMEYKFGEEHYNHTRQVHPWADLERFPFVTYDLDYSSTPNIVIGDSLPEFVYRLPLKMTTEEGNRDIVTLDSYSDSELIVLDFWAPWCSPCVASLDTWNTYLYELSDKVKVVGVMLDYEYKAQRFGVDRGWQIPTVYGIEAYMLNSFFFDRQVVSRSVWIRDGKLIAVTGTKGYDIQLIEDLLADRPVTLPLRHEWTYSQSKP